MTGSVMRSRMFITFVALCLVSLFADMTYEGCRSVLGAYLEILGATALIAGSVSIGEFIGYVMRAVGGFIAGSFKSSKVFWGLIFVGYFINLVAVPLLAIAGNWQLALVLAIAERVGKGLRTPARDVVLAEVTEGIGRGKGFGIHELMDQVGAVSGPLLVALSLRLTQGNYPFTFAILAFPALSSLVALSLAYRSYPTIKAVEEFRGGPGSGLGRAFWLFTVAIALLSMGYMHWGLTAYVMKSARLVPDYLVATMYLIAMLADAVVAYPIGYLYDRVGPKTVVITPLLAAITTPILLLTNDVTYLIAASLLWGIVMGVYETVIRVVIADSVTPENRAYAYGIYGIVFGTAWALGNIIMGFLYTLSVMYVITYVALVESLALTTMALFVLRFRAYPPLTYSRAH